MSSYLHIFPVVDGPLLDELETLATKQKMTFKAVKRGTIPTRDDFTAAISKVEPYDYTFEDQGGTMDLRFATSEELHTLLSSIAKTCGAQIVMTDNTEMFVFQPDTTLDEFANSIIFNG
jgi:hypothetical protein